MADVEHELDSLDAAAATDNTRALLAALTTLLVASGSIIIWRRAFQRRALELPSDDANISVQDSQSGGFKQSFLHAALSSLRLSSAEKTDQNSSVGISSDSSAGRKQPARSKERRRRGKDPLKEIMKGGKRSQSLLKQLKLDASPHNSSDPSRTTMSRQDGSVLQVEDRDRYSRHSSLGPSSRSSSVSVSASRSSHDTSVTSSVTPSLGVPNSDDGTERNTHIHSDHDDATSSILYAITASTSTADPHEKTPVHHDSSPRLSRAGRPTLARSIGAQDSAAEENVRSSSTRSHSPSPSEFDSQSGSCSVATASTSPPPSSSPSFDKTDERYLAPSQSMPVTSQAPSTEVTPSGQNHADRISITLDQNGKDGDRNLSASVSEPTTASSSSSTASSSSTNMSYRKPPRFRSKSRQANAGSPLAGNLSFGTLPGTASFASASASSVALATADAVLPAFVYPTLNPATSPVSPQHLSSHSHISNFDANSRPRPTPAPTPPPPGEGPVSVQTQLASLRGALEAMKLREEKSRIEIEAYARECESLRRKWGEETNIWRRRELDYQTHIYYLTQQLQAYAVLVSQNSLASSSSSALHSNPPSRPFSPLNSLAMPSHLTSHVSQAASLQSSPQLGQAQLYSTFPPMSMSQNRGASSGASSPTTSSFGPNGYPTSPPYPPNIFSLFFPGAPGPSTSAHSTPGTSSVGSMSPGTDFSQSPLHGRGRRRLRQPLNEGWVTGSAVENGEDIPEEDESSETELNDMLADAILKRPESMRSRSGRKSPAQAERPIVITFPSISDIGNVITREEDLADAEDDPGGDDRSSTEEGVRIDDDTRKEKGSDEVKADEQSSVGHLSSGSGSVTDGCISLEEKGPFS